MPFNCDKHGYILHGTTCINCEREQEQITPKITPQTPRFSPLFADNIRIAENETFWRYEHPNIPLSDGPLLDPDITGLCDCTYEIQACICLCRCPQG